MINFSSIKEKKTITFTLIMLTVIVGCLFFYFKSFINLKTDKTYHIKQNILSNIKNGLEEGMISVNTEKAIQNNEIQSLQSQIYQLQTVMADKMVLPKQSTIIKDEFSKILFTLIFIEKKLESGGNIVNDVLKLKVFSSDIKDILYIINTFADVKELKSKHDLLQGFNAYIRGFKASQLRQKGIFDKILHFASKYIAILSINNKDDEVLLKAEQFLKEGDYTNAYLSILGMKGEYEDEGSFMIHLEHSYKVKQGLDSIYFIIETELAQ